jgi:hypothetical protein
MYYVHSSPSGHVQAAVGAIPRIEAQNVETGYFCVGRNTRSEERQQGGSAVDYIPR